MNKEQKKPEATSNYIKTEAEWKAILSNEEYNILRKKGTEAPHSGKYNLHFKEGIYSCKGCGIELFSSSSKFEAHCGWPSFDEEISKGKIKEIIDHSHGMIRTEIICAKCKSHLGHVFNDGPTTTGLRYCVNSISLEFSEKNTLK